MISTTMATALNEQIKWEMYSANLYLAMSAYLQDAGLTSCQGRTGFRHGYFPAMVCHRTGGRGRNRQGHHQQITHD